MTNIPDDFKSVSASGNIRPTNIYIGFVRETSDAQKMGRLRVFIPELGGDGSNENNWYTMGYASPFAGATNVEDNKTGEEGKKLAGTQQSYGFWMVPPDVGNMVLCCFVNGDVTRGYWFACIYQQFMNHMVPAIAINQSTQPEIDKLNIPPVAEYNKKDEGIDVWEPKRPIFTPLHEGLREQGLYTDPERGPATTSARRESPSKVFGFSSPRGNNIHIDDDDENEFIRFRTRSGVQLLIHETTGYIYMISKKGNSWMEISDEGIDMYSKRSISLRAEENINLHADKNIIQNSGGGAHASGGNVTQSSSTRITTSGQAAVQTQGSKVSQNAPPDYPDPSSGNGSAY